MLWGAGVAGTQRLCEGAEHEMPAASAIDLAASPAPDAPTAGLTRPPLTFWHIWSMCIGFMGLQFGFALQNANMTRIFQNLGASIDQIPLLWLAAPLTGLIVQPLVGYASDRTWTRLGRRRPFFLAGAVLSATAMIAMPHAPVLWVAGALLWMLDASLNIAMEPFRAFVADQLPSSQRPTGYALQSFFIGVGAVVASMLPWILANAGVANSGAAVPDTVRYAFYLGAGALFAAIAWTVFRTREYPPETVRAFAAADPAKVSTRVIDSRETRRQGLLWSVAGLAAIALVAGFDLDPMLYVLCVGILLWGLGLLVHGAFRGSGMFATIMHDLQTMPEAMRRLIPVQFFSWLALFAMWSFTTPAVTQVHFGATDPASAVYNEGANWVGVLFGAYNGFAALAAIVIPIMVVRLGIRVSHLVNLCLGGAGLVSFLFLRDPQWLLLSMVGVGFAWASILSLPYALLADSVPAQKMGLYMGIFNFFIVIPQIVAATVLGFLLRKLFDGEPIYALVIGGVSLAIAGLFVLNVPRPISPR
jgi:maltose/moltooligosaccharide transporter